MTYKVKPKQVPDAAAQAAHDVFWNAVYDGKSIDLEIEFDRLFHYAIAAAVNTWPGMTTEPRMWRTAIILPLTEKTDD